MKELFQKLSNLFKFSKEDRLVYQEKPPQPQPTQEEAKEGAPEKATTPPTTPPSTPEEGVAKTEKAGHEVVEATQIRGPRGIKEAQKIATAEMPETGPVVEPEELKKTPEVVPEVREGESVAGAPLETPPGSTPESRRGIEEKLAEAEKEGITPEMAEAQRAEAEPAPEPRRIEPTVAETEMPETGPIMKPEELKKTPEVVPEVPGEKPRIAVDTESVEEVEEE